MKLWEKNIPTDSLIESFTIGNDPQFDMLLARYDVEGTKAHIQMLCAIGLITEAELESLLKALQAVEQSIEAETFVIEGGVEDVHSQIELLLTRELGDVGKKIHAGRSRNDQVMLDLRLFFRAELTNIAVLTFDLFDELIRQSEKYKDVLMPGYTHTQVAMVSSFGMWLSAFAESLTDDIVLLEAVARVNNQNPLGSAAGYGSSFPLDRKLTTTLLGFDDLAYNSIHAQLGRGKTELFMAFAMSAIGATLNKLASDIVLFSSENYNFLKLPVAYTTGSSIMPHKKNPDVLELIRGYSNMLQSLPSQVSMLNSNLISGYHRDFQLLKEIIFPAIQRIKNCLELMTRCVANLTINETILKDDQYKYLFTVEKVNELVMEGVPFRDAYQQVAQLVEKGDFEFYKAPDHSHEGSIGNLCLEEIQVKMQRLKATFQKAGK